MYLKSIQVLKILVSVVRFRPPGTTFTKENSGLDFEITRYKCVIQKHTKHTLFAVFLGFVQSGITVLNTVKLLSAWLAQ